MKRYEWYRRCGPAGASFQAKKVDNCRAGPMQFDTSAFGRRLGGKPNNVSVVNIKECRPGARSVD